MIKMKLNYSQNHLQKYNTKIRKDVHKIVTLQQLQHCNIVTSQTAKTYTDQTLCFLSQTARRGATQLVAWYNYDSNSIHSSQMASKS